jgi:hypothetical protein
MSTKRRRLLPHCTKTQLPADLMEAIWSFLELTDALQSPCSTWHQQLLSFWPFANLPHWRLIKYYGVWKPPGSSPWTDRILHQSQTSPLCFRNSIPWPLRHIQHCLQNWHDLRSAIFHCDARRDLLERPQELEKQSKLQRLELVFLHLARTCSEISNSNMHLLRSLAVLAPACKTLILDMLNTRNPSALLHCDERVHTDVSEELVLNMEVLVIRGVLVRRLL